MTEVRGETSTSVNPGVYNSLNEFLCVDPGLESKSKRVR